MVRTTALPGHPLWSTLSSVGVKSLFPQKALPCTVHLDLPLVLCALPPDMPSGVGFLLHLGFLLMSARGNPRVVVLECLIFMF